MGDSVLGKKLYISNTANDALKVDGGVFCKTINNQGSASYLGTVHTSTSEWLGFYSRNWETRKGWIGHDGGNDFFFLNERSGSLRLITKMSNGNSVEARLDGSYPSFSPDYTNYLYIGNSDRRWKQFYGSNSDNISSDRKIKKDITPIQNAFDFIMSLKPVSYRKIDADTGRLHLGFIAQDVAKIAQQTDMGDLSLYQASVKGGGYYDHSVPDDQLEWGLTYEEFIAPMVATIQQQQKQIDDLNERLSKLERKI